MSRAVIVVFMSLTVFAVLHSLTAATQTKRLFRRTFGERAYHGLYRLLFNALSGITYLPLWWLMGAIVSFYFGARYQVKGQEFKTKIAKVAAVSVAIEPAEKPASVKNDDYRDNAALLDWQAQYGSS